MKVLTFFVSIGILSQLKFEVRSVFSGVLLKIGVCMRKY